MVSVIQSILLLSTIVYVAFACFFFIGLFRLKKPHNTKKYTVSVIVAARNEEENIEACITSLVNQTYPQEKYTITIVDDQSDDNTAALVRKYLPIHSNLQLIRIKTPSETLTPKKNALNEAIQHSEGEIIMATDADCVVQPTWIEGIIQHFQSNIGMVVGVVNLKKIDSISSVFFNLQQLELLSLFSAAAGSIGNNWVVASSGGNFAYRRKTFDQIDGFSTIGHLVSGDDDLLLQEMDKKTEWEAAFATEKNTVVSTEPMHSVKEFFGQRKRWASKGLYYKPLFTFYLTATYLTSALLLVSFIGMLFYPSFGIVPLICLVAKSVIDFCVIFRGTTIFGNLNLLYFFPLWEILHIPYITIMGAVGMLTKIEWKGRKHRYRSQTTVDN